MQLGEGQALSGIDAVVHLAGEGVVDKRWNAARKKRLKDSRILGSQNLIDAMAALPTNQRPKVLIAASAIGYYGGLDCEPKSEGSRVGSGFLAELCAEWEQRTALASKSGIRTVIMRIGIVLAKDGGLLSKAGPAILGSGKTWMSWIHIEDLIQFILRALEVNALSGVYNLVSPNPVTNREFTKALAKQRSFPFVVRIPAICLKVMLGEMSEVLLANQNILPTRTISSGFRFRFEKIQDALGDLLNGETYLDNRYSNKQFIPVARHEVFAFFSKAENLETLTPPWLGFRIEKKSTPFIQEGSLIEYRLRIHGIPVRWKTLISKWEPESVFIDDQLRGPYSKWHHVHRFESVPGGTLISDEVTFRPPGAILGKALLLPIIRKDVNNIFKFRQNKINALCLHGGLK